MNQKGFAVVAERYPAATVRSPRRIFDPATRHPPHIRRAGVVNDDVVTKALPLNVIPTSPANYSRDEEGS